MKIKNPFTENDYLELLEACDYIMSSAGALYSKTHFYLAGQYAKYCEVYEKRGIIYKYFNKKSDFKNFVYCEFDMYPAKVDKHNLLNLHSTDLDYGVEGYVYRQNYSKAFDMPLWFCRGIHNAPDEELEVLRLSSAFPVNNENFIKFFIQLKQYSVNPPVFDFDEITYCKIILGYYSRLKAELEK